MYRYHYINKKNGASVYSHSPLTRENLVLKNKYQVEGAVVKTTDFTEALTKPVTYAKPKVKKVTRKRKAKK